MSNLEVASLMHHQRSDIQVVILSMYNDLAHASAAMQNGASTYILKEDVVTHLERAVKAAASGQVYLSPSLSDLTAPIRRDMFCEKEVVSY